MKRIVLTGNIASGKSTVAEQLKQLGQRVVSADDCVHELLKRKEIQSEIQKHLDMKEVSSSEKFTTIIRRNLFESSAFQKWYLPWIHAHVATMLQAHIGQQQRQDSAPLFLDIPLFFESAHRWLTPDQIWLVWTPDWLRHLRWQKRLRASREVMAKMDEWQIPDEEKFQKTDIILVNTLGKSYLGEQVLHALKQLT